MTGQERDVEALTKVVRSWTLCDDGSRFDHGSARGARAILASDWLAERDAAIRDEAKAEALAPIRALADEWEADIRDDEAWLRGSRISVSEAQELPAVIRSARMNVKALRALLDGGDQ